MLPLLSSRARYREVFHRAGFSFSESFVSIFGDSKAPAELYSSIIEPKRKGETWIAIGPVCQAQRENLSFGLDGEGGL